MTDNVHVPYGDNAGDTATLLLAAAEEKGLPAHVVVANPFDGTFTAPPEVVKSAGLETINPNQEFDDALAEAEKYVEETDGVLRNETVTSESDDTALTYAEDEDKGSDEPKPPAKKVAAKKAPAKRTAAKKSTSPKGA